MKIYLAALLCWMLSGGILYAQKSTYLKAEVGFGRSTVRESPRGLSANWTPLPARRLAVTRGIQMNRLNVEIGFGYARGGGRATLPDNSLSCYGMSATHRYTWLTLPVSAGYNLKLGQRWAVQPRLGLESGYLISQNRTVEFKPNISEEFAAPLQKRPMTAFSLSSSAALHLHYRVTPAIEIFGGPSYRYMLNNGAAETLYTKPPYYQLRTTSATFDAGVKLRLNSVSPAKQMKQE